MNTKIFYSVFITTIVVLFLSLGASLGFSSYQLIKADSEALTDYTLKLKKVIEENPDIDLTLLDINQYRINLIHKDGTVYFDSQVKDNLENIDSMTLPDVYCYADMILEKELKEKWNY